eukprot:8136500-Pyramimonas_sp.AAC.1
MCIRDRTWSHRGLITVGEPGPLVQFDHRPNDFWSLLGHIVIVSNVVDVQSRSVDIYAERDRADAKTGQGIPWKPATNYRTI